MSLVARVRRWLEAGFSPQQDLSRWRRLLALQLKLYLHVGRETITAGYLLRAAALSFATLLALIPLTTLTFSLCLALSGIERQDVERAATEVLRSYLLGANRPDRAPNLPAEAGVRADIYLVPLPTGQEPLSSGEQPPATFLPLPVARPGGDAASEQQLSHWSEGIVQVITGLAGRASSARTTTAHLALLILTGILLFNAIESSFNAIWHVRSRRRVWVKLTAFCTMLLIGPLLIVTSVYLSTYLAPMRDYLRGFTFAPGALERFALLLPPLVITWLAFFLAYLVIPHARVKWRNAMAAALVAAVLWEVAKHGFGTYVAHMVSYRRVYGSLAVIPIFMLWIFLTWLIALFGAGVTYTSQHLAVLDTKRRRDLEGGTVSVHLALSLALEIARRFDRGLGPAPAAHLAQAVQTSEEEIRDTLQPLVKCGILSMAGRSSYQPARPLEKIALGSVLAAVRECDAHAPLLAEQRQTVLEVLRQSRLAEAEQWQGVTLKELLETTGAPIGPATKDGDHAQARGD